MNCCSGLQWVAEIISLDRFWRRAKVMNAVLKARVRGNRAVLPLLKGN